MTSSWPSGEVTFEFKNGTLLDAFSHDCVLKRAGISDGVAAKRDQAFFIFINFIGLIMVSHFLILKILLSDGVFLPLFGAPNCIL